MPRGKQWHPLEVAAVAKAYVEVTLDSVRGADQTLETFVARILVILKRLAPADLLATSVTYHYRGAAAYPYLRDNVLRDIQKFNSALRIVYVSEPTGTSEQEKINMAVAIHMGKTNRMNYAFKDFDAAKEWRNYLAWIELSKLGKFAYSTQMPGTAATTTARNATSGDENNENAANTMEEARTPGPSAYRMLSMNPGRLSLRAADIHPRDPQHLRRQADGQPTSFGP
jgi:hypothetical protein